jgi:phospholipid/cholesterol/gamma-HCH transport system substrate-binding protein
MPRTRSLAWSELKIGLLTIAAIIIAAVLVFSLTGAKGWFWQRYTLKSRFPTVAGLAVGSPVRVAGMQVGSVKDIQFAGEQVDVVFDVNKKVQDRITDKSFAYLGSVSLLGSSAVDITPMTAGTPIPEYGYVPQGHAKGQFSDIAEQASGTIDEVTGLVHDLRQGKGSAGKLITDDRLYNELQEFVATAGQMTREIQSGKGTVGKLLKDPKAAQSLEASMKNIEDLTRKLNAGEGSLGRLLKDEAFAKSLTGATDNLRTLTDHLNSGQGTAGKLLTDDALYTRLNALTTQFDQLATKLNAGEGTAGQLLKDKQLYENMNGAVGDLRALLKAIEKDPKKYLNVKVSIF